MTSTARARRLQHAKASREALTLCEASMLTRPRVSPRMALRDAGVPPHLAARLCARPLHAEPEDGR